MQDEQLNSLAAKLYERHKEALDFIFLNRPKAAGLLDIITDLIGGCVGLVADSRAPNNLRFSVEQWDEALSFRVDKDKWSKTGRGILFEAKTYAQRPGRLNLSLMIGPGDQTCRKRFYEAAQARPELFVGRVKPMGEQFAAIYSHDLLTAEAAENMSAEAQAANVRFAWSEFQGVTLPQLIDAILQIDAEIAGKS